MQVDAEMAQLVLSVSTLNTDTNTCAPLDWHLGTLVAALMMGPPGARTAQHQQALAAAKQQLKLGHVKLVESLARKVVALDEPKRGTFAEALAPHMNYSNQRTEDLASGMPLPIAMVLSHVCRRDMSCVALLMASPPGVYTDTDLVGRYNKALKQEIRKLRWTHLRPLLCNVQATRDLYMKKGGSGEGCVDVDTHASEWRQRVAAASGSSEWQQRVAAAFDAPGCLALMRCCPLLADAILNDPLSFINDAVRKHIILHPAGFAFQESRVYVDALPPDNAVAADGLPVTPEALLARDDADPDMWSCWMAQVCGVAWPCLRCLRLPALPACSDFACARACDAGRVPCRGRRGGHTIPGLWHVRAGHPAAAPARPPAEGPGHHHRRGAGALLQQAGDGGGVGAGQAAGAAHPAGQAARRALR
jgi:hypothetical protein